MLREWLWHPGEPAMSAAWVVRNKQVVSFHPTDCLHVVIPTLTIDIAGNAKIQGDSIDWLIGYTR